MQPLRSGNQWDQLGSQEQRQRPALSCTALRGGAALVNLCSNASWAVKTGVVIGCHSVLCKLSLIFKNC